MERRYNNQNSVKQVHSTLHPTPTNQHRTNVKKKKITVKRTTPEKWINKPDKINKQDTINPKHTKNSPPSRTIH